MHAYFCTCVCCVGYGEGKGSPGADIIKPVQADVLTGLYTAAAETTFFWTESEKYLIKISPLHRQGLFN